MYRISYTIGDICNPNKKKDGSFIDGPCLNQKRLFESANYVSELVSNSVNLIDLLAKNKELVLPFRKYLSENGIQSYNDFSKRFSVISSNVSIHLIDGMRRTYILDLPAALGIDKFVYISNVKNFEKLSFLFDVINPSSRKSRTGEQVKLYKYTGEDPILRKFSGEFGISQTEWSKLLDYGGYKFLIGEGDLDPQIFKKTNRGNIYIQFSNLENKIKAYSHLQREKFSKLDPEVQRQIVINEILDSAFKGQRLDIHPLIHYIRYTVSPNDERYKEEYANVTVGGRKASDQGLTIREWANVLGVQELSLKTAFNRFLRGKSNEEKDKLFSNILYVNYLSERYSYTGKEQKVLDAIKIAQDQLRQLVDDASDEQISKYIKDYLFLNDEQKQLRIQDYLAGKFEQSDFVKIFNKSHANVRQIFKRRNQTIADRNFEKVISDVNSNAESLKFFEKNRQDTLNIVIEVLAGITHKYGMEKLLNDEFADFNEDGITFQKQQIVRYQMPGSDLIGWVYLDGVFKKDNKIVLVVECQGQQHYQFVSFSKTANYSDWLDGIKRDRLKLAFCHDLGIPVIYVSRYLSNEYIEKLFANLRSNIRYYASEVPEQPDLDSFVFVPNSDPQDVQEEVQLYSDRLVYDHLNYIKSELYKDIPEEVKVKFLKDKLIALSKLVLLFEKSFTNEEKDFIKAFTYETDLSRGYEFVKRSFEKISNNPIDFSHGINFGMIESRNITKQQQQSEDFEEEPVREKKIPRRYQEETLISIPDEIKKTGWPQDIVRYRKFLKDGMSSEEALNETLNVIRKRNLRRQYERELLLKGFTASESAKFYNLVSMGQDPESVMAEILSRKRREPNIEYRQELVSLGFKPVDITIYDRRVRAGEDPEVVKADILNKIESRKKAVEYAFGRGKKKRYRIKLLNKKYSGVVMNKTLGKIVKIANILDDQGLHIEADKLTRVAVKLAQNFNDEYSKYEMRTQRDYEKGLDDDGISSGDYSEMAALENDPLMRRYKMEYQKDPMAEGDEELENAVHEKLMDVLAGTYLEDSVANGDELYILEPWLKDEMSLPDACAEYEVGLREHRNDYGDDGYDPLDD